MSGIWGVVDSTGESGITSLADKMALALRHRDWFMVEHVADQDERAAIGRVGIGLFNKAPQPVWNANHTVAVVMAGEIYKVDGVEKLEGGQSPEQLALELYAQAGAELAQHLNGAFIIGIWDKVRQRLVITNDRFGFYPLFYTTYGGRLLFAPEMKGILCDERFPRRLDLTALAEYVRFQHLLGERTFFEDIQFLPNASTLVYDLKTGTCTIRPYWTFDNIPYRPDVSFADAVVETGRLLRQAVQRLSGDSYRPGVFLSGGLDSRTILGLVERRPVASLTFGAKNCRDVYYAERIAKAAGSEHHWIDLPNGVWVKEQVDFHLELTEGLHSWIHAHGMSALPLARQVMDINLTGWDGGTVMGHPDSIEPLQTRAVDDAALIAHVFYEFNQKSTWPSITESEEYVLYCEPLRKTMAGLAFDSFRADFSRYLNCRSDVRSEYFFLRNHCGRLTQNMVTLARSHVEVRFPFFDYELFEFLYALPATVRGGRTLYRAVVQRETPPLAYIPYDHDEFLPTTHVLMRELHALPVKLKRRFNRHIWPIFTERFTLYADYENYLRGELREWAEGILYDRRTTERGLFNPDFIRSLWARHQSGREQWTLGKIAPLMTYEMMLRKFAD